MDTTTEEVLVQEGFESDKNIAKRDRPVRFIIS